ncbi:Thiopurine S-methyltransferase [Thalassocella blandensis]|nr:Thiopurine S-methyltransferase [Thalassocella blandensis]
MEEGFWHKRWELGETAFHEGIPNRLLRNYFGSLSLPANSRVFIPLCGKTTDIAWLRAYGFQVVGVELSEIAVKQLFTDLELEAEIEQHQNFVRYRTEGLDVWVGNIFALNEKLLGPVNAIYDRAALVALPEEMREQYTQQLVSLTHAAPQLLITFEYDQTMMEGPPFSIPLSMVEAYYANDYSIKLITQHTLHSGLKGKVIPSEKAWLLAPHVKL